MYRSLSSKVIHPLKESFGRKPTTFNWLIGGGSSGIRLFGTSAAVVSTRESNPSSSLFFFDHAGVVAPRPQKPKCEDAAITGTHHMGVADGVSAWAQQGIDAGLYAQSLLANTLKYVKMNEFENSEQRQRTADPVKALREGYDATQLPGSTTVSLAFLDVSGENLLTANLGDSGILVFRPSQYLNSSKNEKPATFDAQSVCLKESVQAVNSVSASALMASTNGRKIRQMMLEQAENYIAEGQLRFKSVTSCHQFNMPFQLGLGSPDQPEAAISAKVPVQHGDVVVLCTDGVLDNLFDDEICQTVQEQVTKFYENVEVQQAAGNTDFLNSFASKSLAHEIAWAIAEKSFIASLNMQIHTPFYVHHALDRPRANRSQGVGGKPDDIGVTVGIVRDAKKTKQFELPVNLKEFVKTKGNDNNNEPRAKL